MPDTRREVIQAQEVEKSILPIVKTMVKKSSLIRRHQLSLLLMAKAIRAATLRNKF